MAFFSSLLTCSSCGLLGGRHDFVAGRGDWLYPEPPQCKTCCTMEHYEEEAIESYEKSPAYQVELALWWEERKNKEAEDKAEFEKTHYLYEGKCGDCFSAVWRWVKKEKIISGEGFSCGCRDRMAQEDKERMRA